MEISLLRIMTIVIIIAGIGGGTTLAKNRKVPRLGPGELEILQMLWRERGITIWEAQHALRLPIGYTTVQTRLNRLVKKGLVDRVSNGQVVPLVAQLVNRRKLSQQEIQAIKQFLDAAQQRVPKSKE